MCWMKKRARQKKKGGVPRAIAAALFGILFLWFALPVPVYGVLGIGNALGMLVSAAGFGITLRFSQVAALARRLWKRLPGKLALTAAALCLAAAFFVTAGLGGAMCVFAQAPSPAEAAEARGDETVIVLGCQVKGSRPSLMLSRRLAAAEAYLRAHPGTVAVLSGGQGDDEEISEAECMYNELVASGIDPARLYTEDRSTSTAENLEYAMQIVFENGLSDRVVLVTDGFHQFRARRLAAKYASYAAAVSAKTPVILLPTYAVREMIAIVYHWIAGV